MAESSTKSEPRQGSATESTVATAPGLVPGDATADTKAAQKDASQHISDYCDEVEAELAALEDGIKQIRSAAKGVKSTRDTGVLGEFRDLIFEVLHNVPLLRTAAGPRAHIEHRTLPAPDPNDPHTVSALGVEPIL